MYFASSSETRPPYFSEEPRRNERQRRENKYARADEDQRPESEWGEDEAQRDYGSQIINEAGSEYALAEIRLVQTEFQHYGIHHSNRRGR